MCGRELFHIQQIDLIFTKILKSLYLAGYQTESLLFMGDCLFRLVRERRKKESTGDIFSETQF